MKRTIIEKKIWNKLVFYFFLNTINLLILGISIYKEIIILQVIIIPIIILMQIALVYQGYKLGWEYKRLQMNEEDTQPNSYEKGKELLHELLKDNPKELNSQQDEMAMYCASQSKSNKRDMGNLVDTDDNLDEKEKKQ